VVGQLEEPGPGVEQPGGDVARDPVPGEQQEPRIAAGPIDLGRHRRPLVPPALPERGQIDRMHGQVRSTRSTERVGPASSIDSADPGGLAGSVDSTGSVVSVSSAGHVGPVGSAGWVARAGPLGWIHGCQLQQFVELPGCRGVNAA
jgi:hypothetical protein